MSKVIIACGLAGVGKTTFIKNVAEKLRMDGKSVIVLNIDPAARLLPYVPNVDIRDIVDYQELIETHSLGPNGAILTCLNLFAAKVDQWVHKLKGVSDYILVDPPGQMELFTWSPAGSILTNVFSSIAENVEFHYLMGGNSSRGTFVNNVMQACTIHYSFCDSGSDGRSDGRSCKLFVTFNRGPMKIAADLGKSFKSQMLNSVFSEFETVFSEFEVSGLLSQY